MDAEKKRQEAMQLHADGYNCCQSVVMAFCKELNLEPNLAETMSVSFGRGLAKMGEVCGCVSAMAILSGFVKENQTEDGKVDTKKSVEWTRTLAEEFRTECGDIICRRLKGAEEGSSKPPRSCRELVGEAAALIAAKLG